MNQTKKFALLGALCLVLSGPVLAQSAGGSSGGPTTGAGASEVGGHAGATAGPTEGGMAASGSMGMSKGAHGTTLHKQNKAAHLRGASAAAAASALGTNDKGSPQ
ncbi:hypothetical protein LJR029_000148 [Caballeronia sp. LjRoot29]|uniref:hypothetical protein n=1 Tax=Caballeronia sp. LjRoot29 TaxID=3342315 RepID=UPI003ECDFC81